MPGAPSSMGNTKAAFQERRQLGGHYHLGPVMGRQNAEDVRTVS